MSGYRTSNFDPYAGSNYGRPLKPFNWVQWTGAGFIAAGVLVLAAALADRLRVIDLDTKDLLPISTSLCVLGALFVNSRRETLSPEDAARRKRQTMIGAAIGLAICAAGAAVIFYFKGA